jgi:hypothetical protein
MLHNIWILSHSSQFDPNLDVFKKGNVTIFLILISKSFLLKLMNCHYFYQHFLILFFFVFLLGLFSMVIIFLFHLDLLCFPCQFYHHPLSLDFWTSSVVWFTLTILVLLMLLNVEGASIHTSSQACKAQSL